MKCLARSRLLLTLGLAAAFADAARADFNPVALTPGSYKYDIVVPADSLQPIGSKPPTLLSASSGQGVALTDSTYAEQGTYNFPGLPGSNVGLPAPGTILTNINNPNVTWVMPPTYFTNDDLQVSADAGYSSGTFTFTTPVTATNLAILCMSGNGSSTFSYTVNHADGSIDSGNLAVKDWFSGAGSGVQTNETIAWGNDGRDGMPAGGFENVTISSNNASVPYLYETNITTSAGSPITGITINYLGGGWGNFYAVSANGSGNTWAPVTVSGYNQMTTLPKESCWQPVQGQPGSYKLLVNATMDGGTTITTNLPGAGNTWFEQGWLVGTQSVFGLPPSGSTFSSLSNATHHYTMGDYHANNAILIDVNHQSTSITPATPSAYVSLAFLTAGANIGGGAMTNTAVIQHADGVNETNTFLGFDWFGSGNIGGNQVGFVAWIANGRVNLSSRALQNLNSGNPKLFENFFTMSDVTSPITNIIVGFGEAPSAGATTWVMAVAGSTVAVPPLIAGQPQWVNTYAGMPAQLSVTLATGTTPTYIWQRSPTETGTYTTVANGGDISGATTKTLSFSAVTPSDAGYYQVIITNASGSVTSAPVALYLLTSTAGDVTTPFDTVTESGNSIPDPVGFGPTNLFNQNTTPYMPYGSGVNFGGPPFAGPVQVTDTPQFQSIVTGLRIFTAAGVTDDDPADVMLEGSNDGGSTWATILPDTALNLPLNRNQTGLPIVLTNQPLQEVDFANTTGYSEYRLTFNNARNDTTATNLQIAEVQILGVATGPPIVLLPYSLPETNGALLHGTAVLQVNDAGAPPLTHQWSFNGTPLSDNAQFTGTHSNILVIHDVELTNAGEYTLGITNAQGFYNVYPGGGADQYLTVSVVPNFFVSGGGWSHQNNGVPNAGTFANGALTLTVDAGSTASSAFYDTPLYVGAFSASFTYLDQTPGLAAGADGIAFVLQTSSPTALGGGGGSLGYNGIASPSAAFEINIYNGHIQGFALATDGAINYAPLWTNNAGVTLAQFITSGDPINVNILYKGGSSAQLTLTDAGTVYPGTTFATNEPWANIPALLGTNAAFVGFTGGDGGVKSTQIITNFTFVPIPSVSAAASGANLVFTWPMGPGLNAYTVQSSTSLTAPSWQNVTGTYTQVGNENEITVPRSTAQQEFYRLTITP